METPTATTIDWLRFRTQADPGDVLQALRGMFPTFADELSLSDHGRGVHGFRDSLRVKLLGQVPIARLDFGGDAQRGWLRCELSGKACAQVEDWAGLADVEALPQAQLRRLDIALTTWRGEVTHELVVDAHTAGQFTTSGRPPALRQIISTDPRAGRTCYVGSREMDKFFRAYEKGYELAAQFPGAGVTHVQGFPIEDIYRCELECKATAHDLPWSMVGQRDQYFAGAYPFCRELLPEVEPDVLQRRPERAAQTELAAALATVKAQSGRILYTALMAYHGDMGAVFSKVLGKEHCQRLVEAGVLLTEHAE